MSSSSAVHLPFFRPTFSQHGALPIPLKYASTLSNRTKCNRIYLVILIKPPYKCLQVDGRGMVSEQSLYFAWLLEWTVSLWKLKNRCNLYTRDTITLGIDGVVCVVWDCATCAIRRGPRSWHLHRLVPLLGIQRPTLMPLPPKQAFVLPALASLLNLNAPKKFSL